MKKGLIIGAVLLLAGCSSTIDTTYYQLPAGSNMARVSSDASASQPMIWVEQVSVPDYLAGNGLVYQTSDVKYVIAANNLWASPLDQQLQQTLVSNLGQALPGGWWPVSRWVTRTIRSACTSPASTAVMTARW